MHSTHRLLSTILVVVSSLSAQSEKLPLRVLFIGEAGHEARTEDFVAFLATRFAVVQAVTHATVPSDVQTSADVVLLDWNQGEKTQLPPPSCPLGLRAQWKTPTVLLGSAGLFVACIWKVNGGSG